MDWGRLQTFIALARAGNLARAGRALNQDPTTVSRNIRGLEQDLGRTLFEHGRDGQILTADGRGLLACAEAMETAALRFEESHADAAGDSGLVRVSVAEGFGTWFVAPRLARFVAAHPRIVVDLVANSGFLNPSRKEADIAILLAQPRKGPLRTRKLTDYALGLYARRDLALSTDRLALVSYIPDFIYAPELNYLEEIALDVTPTLRSSSINAQHQMIAAGAGFGVLPCFMGDADPRLSRIRSDIIIRRAFWLAVHQDVIALPRVRHFIDWLVGACGDDRHLLLGQTASVG